MLGTVRGVVMTTATESHDAQLAAIKARHEDVRAKFRDPSVREVEVPADMRLEQTGLSSAMVDDLGRFWLAAGRTMRMIFDPNIGDTQAAQGFKAHE